MVPTIKLVDDPSQNLRELIAAPLGRFNDLQCGNDDVSAPLALTLTAPGSAETVGGLWGDTGWDYLHIEFLFVPEAARGAGIGRDLIRRAEDEAIRRGCRRAWLDTFSFQARGFYERLGYTVFGTLHDFPSGHSRFFMEKTLVPVSDSSS